MSFFQARYTSSLCWLIVACAPLFACQSLLSFECRIDTDCHNLDQCNAGWCKPKAEQNKTPQWDDAKHIDWTSNRTQKQPTEAFPLTNPSEMVIHVHKGGWVTLEQYPEKCSFSYPLGLGCVRYRWYNREGKVHKTAESISKYDNQLTQTKPFAGQAKYILLTIPTKQKNCDDQSASELNVYARHILVERSTGKESRTFPEGTHPGLFVWLSPFFVAHVEGKSSETPCFNTLFSLYLDRWFLTMPDTFNNSNQLRQGDNKHQFIPRRYFSLATGKEITSLLPKPTEHRGLISVVPIDVYRLLTVSLERQPDATNNVKEQYAILDVRTGKTETIGSIPFRKGGLTLRQADPNGLLLTLIEGAPSKDYDGTRTWIYYNDKTKRSHTTQAKVGGGAWTIDFHGRWSHQCDETVCKVWDLTKQEQPYQYKQNDKEPSTFVYTQGKVYTFRPTKQSIEVYDLLSKTTSSIQIPDNQARKSYVGAWLQKGTNLLLVWQGIIYSILPKRHRMDLRFEKSTHTPLRLLLTKHSFLAYRPPIPAQKQAPQNSQPAENIYAYHFHTHTWYFLSKRSEREPAPDCEFNNKVRYIKNTNQLKIRSILTDTIHLFRLYEPNDKTSGFKRLLLPSDISTPMFRTPGPTTDPTQCEPEQWSHHNSNSEQYQLHYTDKDNGKKRYVSIYR